MNEIRKKDAREKISLGGLVVKAGLRNENISFILGSLIEAAKIKKDSPEYNFLKKIGEQSFLKNKI